MSTGDSVSVGDCPTLRVPVTTISAILLCAPVSADQASGAASALDVAVSRSHRDPVPGARCPPSLRRAAAGCAFLYMTRPPLYAVLSLEYPNVRARQCRPAGMRQIVPSTL